MRHSSWTLFLVPLALPLVLMAFPGQMRQANQRPAETGVAVELVQETTAPSSALQGASSGSLEDTATEPSESLFKD